MRKETIIKLIRKALLKGISPNKIRKALLKKGIKPDIIEEAMKDVYKTHIHNIKDYIKNEIELGYKLEDIRKYLISIGHPKKQIDLAIGVIQTKTFGQKVIDEKKLIKEKILEETQRLKDLIEKELEEVRESLESKKKKLEEDFLKLPPWKKGAFVGFSVITIISIITEIFMVLFVYAETGEFNCYSPYRFVNCTTLEGLGYYLLLFVAFTIVFAIPAAVIGSLIMHFIWKEQKPRTKGYLNVLHKNNRTNL